MVSYEIIIPVTVYSKHLPDDSFLKRILADAAADAVDVINDELEGFGLNAAVLDEARIAEKQDERS